MAFWDGTRWISGPQLRLPSAPTAAYRHRPHRLRNLFASTVVVVALAATVIPSGPARAIGPSLTSASLAATAPTGDGNFVSDATATAASTPTGSAASLMPTLATALSSATPGSIATSAPARTAGPWPGPTDTPAPAPTGYTTPTPTDYPTPDPTDYPTPDPTDYPTPAPTDPPTQGPIPTAAPTPIPPSAGWVTVVNDQFNSGGVPRRWQSYDGPYGSGPHNCAIPSHSVVSGGYLHLLMSYETSTSLPCGAGWYTAGLSLSGYSSVDQRVTVRFRVVDTGVAGHFIIPMRWPDIDSSWPAGGEEDYCETDAATRCATYLHYGASNSQSQHSYSVRLTQWHTVRFQRLNHVVKAYIYNMTTPVWTFTGNATTLPNTLKHVVLQQECQSSCPAGTSGKEDIQIDWITVENPA